MQQDQYKFVLCTYNPRDTQPRETLPLDDEYTVDYQNEEENGEYGTVSWDNVQIQDTLLVYGAVSQLLIFSQMVISLMEGRTTHTSLSSSQDREFLSLVAVTMPTDVCGYSGSIELLVRVINHHCKHMERGNVSL